MRHIVIVVAVARLLIVPVAADQLVPDSATPADVKKLLGVPTEVVVQGDMTTWLYGEKPEKQVVFTDGRANRGTIGLEPIADTIVHVRPEDTLYHTADCPLLRGQVYRSIKLSEVDTTRYKPDPRCHPAPSRPIAPTPAQLEQPTTVAGLRGLALYFSKSNQPETALQYSRRCLALKPNDKDCVDIERTTRSAVIGGIQLRLGATALHDLYSRRAYLLKARDTDPSNPAFETDVRAVSAEILQLRERTTRYVQKLHASGYDPLPNDIASYTDTMPESMHAVTEAAVHSAIAAAEAQLATGAFAGAHTTIRPVAAHPEAKPVSSRITDAARLKLDADWRFVARGPNLRAIESFVTSLDQFRGPMTDEDVSAVRSQAIKVAVQLLQHRGEVLGVLDAATARTLVAALRNTAPVLAKSLIENLANNTPGGFAIQTRVDIDRNGIDCDDFDLRSVDASNVALPNPFTHSTDGESRFVIQSIRCSVETKEAAPELVNSKYVATYRQDVNPQYVQLQSDLQVAQTQLTQLKLQHALNPPANAWVGLAQGIAEAAAQATVNRIVTQLSDTAPFTQRPVELAYTAYKVRATRSATISIFLMLDDRQSGFGDSVEIVGSSQSTGEGLRGVDDRDSQHLENRPPPLDTAKELIAKAFVSAETNLAAGLRQLGHRMFLSRASSAFTASRPAGQILGNLLYSRDLMSNASDLESYSAAYRVLDALTIDGLDTLTVDPALFPKAVSKANVRSTASALTRVTGDRATMLKDSMAAVVLIKAGNKSGSGFFVGSDGLLLTNAHVVSGVSRVSVHTPDGESFLATPVSVSNDYDLALMKIVGRPRVALSLGESSVVSVGTDIVAIGNPLGLQGTVTKGIVSAIRKIGGMTFLQIDAAINPGNSGGPLLLESGEVVGITTWKVGGDGTELLGFAIAIDDAKKVFRDYLR